LIALSAAARPRQGYRSDLQFLKMPILLFVGDRDNRYAIVQRAAKELDVEQLVVLPGASHATSLFASATLLPHVNAFLLRHAGIPPA
jgi:pimeloyl-ACP methyl ester carboxylesterase